VSASASASAPLCSTSRRVVCIACVQRTHPGARPLRRAPLPPPGEHVNERLLLLLWLSLNRTRFSPHQELWDRTVKPSLVMSPVLCCSTPLPVPRALRGTRPATPRRATCQCSVSVSARPPPCSAAGRAPPSRLVRRRCCCCRRRPRFHCYDTPASVPSGREREMVET
jgi:hypothetical protein